MEHGYSLPRPSTDAVPLKRKRTWEANDPRRLWHKKRGKTRVNTGVATLTKNRPQPGPPIKTGLELPLHDH